MTTETDYGGCIAVVEGKFYPNSDRALHDWRLVSREWVAWEFGASVSGWQEVWYCTRCRLVDERKA